MLHAQKPLIVLLLFTMTLLAVFPLDVVLPSFPALSYYFQTPSSDIALSVSVFAIGLALSALLIGPLSDRLGRKRLLLGGIAVAVVGAVGCVLSTEYRWLLGFRVIQAVGCGCFMLSQALIQDLFSGQEQERMRIAMATAGGIFMSISPLLGSALQIHLGWKGSFYVFIALGILVWLKVWRLLEHSLPQGEGSALGFFRGYWRVCSSRTFVGYWTISAMAFACHFSFIVLSPMIFMDQLGLSSYEFSLTLLLYGVSYIFGGLLAGWLSKRLSAYTQITTGLTLIVFSGLVMLVLCYWAGQSIWTVLAPMLICTAGTTIARPVATSRAMNLFPDLAGTSVSAGTLIIFMFGGLISAVVNLSADDLQRTLAMSLMILSGGALLLNQRIQHEPRASSSDV